MELSGVLRELSELSRCRMHDNYEVHADNDKRLAELFLSLISKNCQFTPNSRVISSKSECEDGKRSVINVQVFWEFRCDRDLLVLKHLIVGRCAVGMGVRCCRRWATPSRLWLQCIWCDRVFAFRWMIFLPILIIFELLVLIVQQIFLSHKCSVVVFVVVVSHAIHLLRWLCVVVGVDLIVLLLMIKLYDWSVFVNFIGENVKIVLWSRSSIPNGCKSAGVADDDDDDVPIKFLHIFVFIFLLSESDKWGTNINSTELHLFFLHILLSRLNFLLFSLSRFHFTFPSF